MCGIAGYVDFSFRTPENILHLMTDVLHHRGPDDSGCYLDRNDFADIGLGHRRLSILDLSPLGHQPMSFQHFVIIYNGEIYNYKEIRFELEQHDYIFDSDSDTEVILKAYHLWGAEMVHKFNGMFAFVLYDKTKNIILLFRDRTGIKPLYWYFKENLILFSSELKSFHQHPAFQKELNADGVMLYFQYGYIPEPYTIFEDCQKLKSGYYVTVNLKNKNITETKYWDVLDFYRKPKLQISEEEAIDETERIFKSAFEYRMVSDVPVGIFLSGGYDSSIVAAILQSNRTEKLKTFAMGFDEEKYDEAPFAKKVAGYLGTDHKEYYCTLQDALDILPLLPEIWDEPFGDTGAIPAVLLSRHAKKDVTVCLSAEGGDETFGGYIRYTNIYKKLKILHKTNSNIKTFINAVLENPLINHFAYNTHIFNDLCYRLVRRFSYFQVSNENEILNLEMSNFTMQELEVLLKHIKEGSMATNFCDYLNQNWLDNILAVDYKTYNIDDCLVKVDRATMSSGLEGREPMLDFRIIEHVARLDPSLKIRNGDKKYILKQIAYKYIPKELLDRPKKGFSAPIERWLRESPDLISCYLNKKSLDKSHIFNSDKIIDLRDRFFNGKKISPSKIWYLLMFEMWREKWCP